MVASGADLVEYGLDAMFDDEAYQVWLAEDADRERVRELDLSDLLGAEPAAPTISVLVRVYRPRLELLEACIASVRRQLYERWELCLCDDGSGDAKLTALLERLAAEDPRIRWSALAENGGGADALLRSRARRKPWDRARRRRRSHDGR